MNASRQLVARPSITGALLVPLSRGLVAVIDSADRDVCEGFNWYAQRSHADRRSPWYATRKTPRPEHRRIYLHSEVARKHGITPIGMLPDHIDGDGLNCRRGNLRAATGSQNAMNSATRSDNRSGRRGVCWDRVNRKWRARIWVAGKCHHLGRFDSKREAAAAYSKAAREHHGEFARPENRQ